jgi:integrase
MTTSTYGHAKRSVVRFCAPARDGRRRLRPWTVTQPWTPRTRPPLLGKRADAFPTPPTAVHGTREKQEERPALALLAVAATLRTTYRVATYRTLIRLLVVTGMRVGEALALDRDDIDVPQRVLTVRHAKFGKSRELPVHPSTVAALRHYLQRDDRPRAATRTAAVFVSLH